jgi:hypothetical protein
VFERIRDEVDKDALEHWPVARHLRGHFLVHVYRHRHLLPMVSVVQLLARVDQLLHIYQGKKGLLEGGRGRHCPTATL